MAATDADTLIQNLLPAVLAAGRAELGHFGGGVSVSQKADSSPVTVADQEAEAILLAALAKHVPQVPVVAEELAAAGHLPAPTGTFFLVDALDGTRYFIKGLPEFSVNVALVEAGRPVFGLIYVPPTGRLYVTRSDGRAYIATVASDTPDGALDLSRVDFKPMTGRAPDHAHMVAFNSPSVGSKSAAFLDALGVKDARPLGSSEKFCLIAHGAGDIYARLGPTYEWDTAAGHAILEAAGGSVTTLDGARLGYGKTDNAYLNPAFVAWGRTPEAAGYVPAAGAVAVNAAGSPAGKPASGS